MKETLGDSIEYRGFTLIVWQGGTIVYGKNSFKRLFSTQKDAEEFIDELIDKNEEEA